MTNSRVPEWDPSNPKNCARAAIAIEFGQHFPNALTDIGDMDTYIYRDLDMLMNSITKVMMARCPPEMLDEIDRELVEISTDTPKDHPLVKLAGYEGTSWEYRYDTLHPFFVDVCADLRLRLAAARNQETGASTESERLQ